MQSHVYRIPYTLPALPQDIDPVMGQTSVACSHYRVSQARKLGPDGKLCHYCEVVRQKNYPAASAAALEVSPAQLLLWPHCSTHVFLAQKLDRRGLQETLGESNCGGCHSVLAFLQFAYSQTSGRMSYHVQVKCSGQAAKFADGEGTRHPCLGVI